MRPSGAPGVAPPCAYPTIPRLAVYCGSASPADPRYLMLAAEVGAMLAEAGIGIVYGGGRHGLMGALADAALAAGGAVIGVVPHGLRAAEQAYEGCTALYEVADLHERKARFMALADGFLVLPGGVGTMDELWEALSWARLGLHAKPIGLLNAYGYYDHLLAFIRHMSAQGFVHADADALVITESKIAPLLPRLATQMPAHASC